jgi:hypothetical protein
MTRTAIDLEYEWVTIEGVPGVAYKYPDPVSTHFRKMWGGAAVYRWVVADPKDSQPTRVYIGEAELLPRRICHYLKPGPSQQTNLRLAEEFKGEIAHGRIVLLQTLSFQPFDLSGAMVTMADLHNKAIRRLLESMMIASYLQSGYQLINA